MARQPGSGFFTLNPRRKPQNLLLRPGLQLRLPVYVLVLSLGVLGLLAGLTYQVYGDLFSVAIAESSQPEWFERTLRAQTGDFALVWGVVSLVYVLAVTTCCVRYVHRMVGPIVPFRRHIEALKNGDFGARIQLRRGDAFEDVARDLNELAELLAEQEKREA